MEVEGEAVETCARCFAWFVHDSAADAAAASAAAAKRKKFENTPNEINDEMMLLVINHSILSQVEVLLLQPLRERNRIMHQMK